MKTGNDKKDRTQNQAGQHTADGLHQHEKNSKGTRKELADKEFDENSRGQQEQVRKAIQNGRR